MSVRAAKHRAGWRGYSDRLALRPADSAGHERRHLPRGGCRSVQRSDLAFALVPSVGVSCKLADRLGLSNVALLGKVSGIGGSW